MKQAFSLVFAFACLFVLQKGQKRKEGNTRADAAFYLRLSAAVGILTVIQNICHLFVWGPSGRDELASASLFLWAVLLDWAINGFRRKERGTGEMRLVVSRFSLALFAFSYWTLGSEGVSTSNARFLAGLALPLATGFLEWVLGGLWDRLRLSEVPPRIQGAPILLWLAMLLALTICKLG